MKKFECRKLFITSWYRWNRDLDFNGIIFYFDLMILLFIITSIVYSIYLFLIMFCLLLIISNLFTKKNNNEESLQKFRLFNIIRNFLLIKKQKEYNTIVVNIPRNFMNCGISVDNNFISDTNDSSNWDTIKFPLPKPKHKWHIKSYGGNINNNQKFVILIDKNE